VCAHWLAGSCKLGECCANTVQPCTQLSEAHCHRAAQHMNVSHAPPLIRSTSPVKDDRRSGRIATAVVASTGAHKRSKLRSATRSVFITSPSEDSDCVLSRRPSHEGGAAPEPNQGAMFVKQPAPLHVGSRPAPSGCPPIRFRSAVRRSLDSVSSRLEVAVRRFDAVVLLCLLTWPGYRRQALASSRSMALLPCRGQAHPHRLTTPLQQQPPSVTTFGRELGAARPLRLGRCAQRSRRLQPCGAWAGERWSRAFAAARSRARQFLQVTVHTSLLTHDGHKALLRQHTRLRVASTANVAVPRIWLLNGYLLSTQLQHVS